ncbi:MAG: HEAT repeat domain-containing protein [Planctomycetaceae bacterium]|nr:HEAT repeat domain-containing protein [Planctomycetaceae bacterium]
MISRIENRLRCPNVWFAAAILFFCGCPSESKPAWFKCASRYVTAQRELAASGGAWDKAAKVIRFSRDYLNAKQPTEAEILSALSSPDQDVQIAGLAAMSIKPIETDRVAKSLFEFLHKEDPEPRWSAVRALNRFGGFSETVKKDLGPQLLEQLKTQNKIDTMEMYLLRKFPSESSAQFLTENLMKEGDASGVKTLRYAAFRALKEMGEPYYKDAISYVNVHGSTELKEQIRAWEQAWRPSQPDDLTKFIE